MFFRFKKKNSFSINEFDFGNMDDFDPEIVNIFGKIVNIVVVLITIIIIGIIIMVIKI